VSEQPENLHRRDAASARVAAPANDLFVQSANSVLAQRVLKSRRERAKLFGSGLFADPAYDILLFLFIKRDAGELVSTAKVCVASDVPEPTAIRYIRMLAEKGFLERMPHPRDKRIINLQLTPIGFEKLDGWLSRFITELQS
jgi:DNA-binding MarR family transcriptional regulator